MRNTLSALSIITILACLLVLPACQAERQAPRPGGFAPEVSTDEADRRAAAYVSPYSARFHTPVARLLPDILAGPRGDTGAESRFNREEWDSATVRRGYGAWGPPARQYSAPELAQGKNAEWKRERVLATALLFTGLSYQHHHIPGWTPPENWPWLPVGRGRNEKGMDCSNFTSFAYNLALGMKLDGDIAVQAREQSVDVPGQGRVEARRIEGGRDFAATVAALKPGDLVYVKTSPTGHVSHVVLWMGENGVSPDGAPLVLDSTGAGHRDASGGVIPDGVRLRPFTADSWYFRSMSHALRFLRDEAGD